MCVCARVCVSASIPVSPMYVCVCVFVSLPVLPLCVFVSIPVSPMCVRVDVCACMRLQGMLEGVLEEAAHARADAEAAWAAVLVHKAEVQAAVAAHKVEQHARAEEVAALRAKVGSDVWFWWWSC